MDDIYLFLKSYKKIELCCECRLRHPRIRMQMRIFDAHLKIIQKMTKNTCVLKYYTNMNVGTLLYLKSNIVAFSRSACFAKRLVKILQVTLISSNIKSSTPRLRIA